MGFWHTGYAEFHEVRGLDDYVYSPPPPTRYQCAHCSESFLDMDALRRHRFEQHPLRQPALWLRGRAVGSLSQRLMTSLQAKDVVLEDVVSCMLNGHLVKPPQLGKRLAAMRQEFVELELVGTGATTRCTLDFQIADEAHLLGVEAAFLRLAREGILSIEAVGRFIQDCRMFLSAMPYCDGICHYLYGVMAKERSPDSGLKQDEYVARYMRASDELAGFDRPLARSVRALVAFHFNHFDEVDLLAPEGPLRHAAGAFAGLLEGFPWHLQTAFDTVTHDAIDALLTDQSTLEILADAGQGLLELKEQTDALLSFQRRLAPGSYDHTKRTLLACEALAARSDAESITTARKLARGLVGQNITSEWANALLERVAILT